MDWTMTTIIVTLQVEGFHKWAKAQEVLPEVGFLSDRHRHIFHITCEKDVNHDDRDIEIIMFKRKIAKYISAKWGEPAEFADMSCEMIAKHLMAEFKLRCCTVLEDGENGSSVRNAFPPVIRPEIKQS